MIIHTRQNNQKDLHVPHKHIKTFYAILHEKNTSFCLVTEAAH